MRPCSELAENRAKGITFFLTDIDDTLTRDGKLESEAYYALWRLYNHNIKVVPVTGRPAGWCDCIVRQWPVDAVIGENGAFAFFLSEGKKKVLYHPDFRGAEGKEKLDAVKNAVLAGVEGALIARDQPYRVSDLAVDFCEEASLLLDDAVRIQEIAESFGAQAKISSIHVNIWFGDFDKFSMAQHILKTLWGVELPGDREKIAFCGDSPNDEPMFRSFPLSFAVGNLRKYEHLISDKPEFIAERWYGQGFSEIVAEIIEKKDK